MKKLSDAVGASTNVSSGRKRGRAPINRKKKITTSIRVGCRKTGSELARLSKDCVCLELSFFRFTAHLRNPGFPVPFPFTRLFCSGHLLASITVAAHL